MIETYRVNDISKSTYVDGSFPEPVYYDELVELLNSHIYDHKPQYVDVLRNFKIYHNRSDIYMDREEYEWIMTRRAEKLFKEKVEKLINEN
jgi:hypothetical protein